MQTPKQNTLYWKYRQKGINCHWLQCISIIQTCSLIAYKKRNRICRSIIFLYRYVLKKLYKSIISCILFHSLNFLYLLFQIKGEAVPITGKKPEEAIISKAEEVKAAMIVMGTRGLGTIRRTLMGSVSDYVVHHAGIPVIVVRSWLDNSRIYQID